MLTHRSRLDRLQWHIMQMRHRQWVRRRISPRDIYEALPSTGCQVNCYLFGVREYRKNLKVEPASPALATDLSWKVMAAEYEAFSRHIFWHNLNRNLAGAPPIITFDELEWHWKRIVAAVLQSAEPVVVQMPVAMPRAEFANCMAEIGETL